MKSLLLKATVTAVGICGYAASAYSISLDVLYTQQSVENKSNDDAAAGDDDNVGDSQDFGLRVLYPVDPMGIVQLGAFGMKRSISLDETYDFDKLTYGGMIYGPELRFVWRNRQVSPYLGARYLFGKYRLEAKEQAEALIEMSIDENVSGYMVGAGFDVALGQMASLSLEYVMSQEKLKYQSSNLKVDGTTIPTEAASDDEGSKYQFTGLMIGVGVRL